MTATARTRQRIVVAMSGGVDSSVVAGLLQHEGHEVIGITLQLYGAAARKKGACCAGQDIYDARRVAETLGIAHYVLDYQDKFKERVIRDFADSYARGETPVPCVRCNERIKFADLLRTARELGANSLATGHYARTLSGSGGSELHVAVDAKRDQSYFLFATTKDQLDFLRFPLGGLHKDTVRAIAADLGLAVAAKPDSQDICFVPDGDYAKTVLRLRPDAQAPGDMVDREGHAIGRHEGVAHFTVGQRKGLGLSGHAKPLFVVALDATEKRVTVGPRESLETHTMRLRDVNWLARPDSPTECAVKVRSTRPPACARVTPLDDGGAFVETREPEHAVAPGQACVFYAGSRVIGGGWIARQAEARAVA